MLAQRTYESSQLRLVLPRRFALSAALLASRASFAKLAMLHGSGDAPLTVWAMAKALDFEPFSSALGPVEI